MEGLHARAEAENCRYIYRQVDMHCGMTISSFFHDLMEPILCKPRFDRRQTVS
jgi:hypothetical protein